jgi:hypothetical protein
MARKAIEQKRWFPFGPRNRRWFGIAVLTIVVGYIFLSIGPYDSFWSLTLAPILLGLGYFVFMPIAILIKDRPKNQEDQVTG